RRGAQASPLGCVSLLERRGGVEQKEDCNEDFPAWNGGGCRVGPGLFTGAGVGLLGNPDGLSLGRRLLQVRRLPGALLGPRPLRRPGLSWRRVPASLGPVSPRSALPPVPPLIRRA